MPNNPKTELLPAKPEDIPTLSQISADSFKSDTHTQLNCLLKNEEFSMVGALESWIALPQERCVVVKAVVGEEIVGWSAWAFRGFGEGEVVLDFSFLLPNTEKKTEKVEEENEKREKTKYTPLSQTALFAHDHKIRSLLLPYHPDITPIERLNRTTNLDMTFWNTHLSHPSNLTPHLTPPSSPSPLPAKHVCLIALTIAPSHQGQGVGSALISFGTEVADRMGVYSWVSSSDGGAGFFGKRGFGEVGRLELDLDRVDYCGGVRNPAAEGEGNWGIYVWRYMRREGR